MPTPAPRIPRVLAVLALAACTALACASPYLFEAVAGKGGVVDIELRTPSGPLRVEGRDGRLYVNDVDCGPLEEGDEVQLDPTGAILVDGEPRYTPNAPAVGQ